MVLHQQFEAQRQAILSNSSGSQYNRDAQAQLTKAQRADYLAGLLVWSEWNDSMRQLVSPILYALVVETGRDAIAQVGGEPSQFNPIALNVLNYAQQRAAKLAEDVNAETEKQIRATLAEGIDQDEDDDELRARVELVMGAALTYRSDRIAKSETTRAQGFADVEAWTQAGTVTGKQWHVQSGNPCKFCNSLDGVIVSLESDFYSLGDVLNVDGSTLKISYENIAYPPIHTNCQCTLLPITVSLGA